MNAKTKHVEESVEDGSEIMDRAKRFGANTWERARGTYLAAQDKAVAGAKAADKTIRARPYQAIGIAFGLGLLFGFLIRKRR